MVVLNGKTGRVGAAVPPHVAAIAEAQRNERQQRQQTTMLNVRYSAAQYNAFFDYVRSEWPDKPCQLLAHPTTRALCVRGTFGESERVRLLDLINQFESTLRDAQLCDVVVLPPSRKRRIRQRNYTKVAS